MKKITALLSLIAIFMMGAGIAQAEQVYYSSGRYYWDAGNSTDLATAITGAIGSGNRTVDIWCGGTLYSTIYLQPGLTLKCHNNTFIKGHGGDGFYRDGSGPYAFYDMTLTRSDKSGMGIRTSRASDATFVNVKITGGSIGIRVDSHPSRPYEDGRWVYNLYVQDCTFENTGSHGLETYGVDGCGVYGITANNCGECGVLFNKTLNASTGTVNAYRCCYGGGYAGLRYANTCGNSTANMLYADECGRGYFVLTGSYNITLKNCQITDCSDVGIWLENVTNCSVQSGCCNCGVAVSGSGSYANVSSTCGSSSSSSSGITGTKKIINRASGKGMDAGGNSNGSNVQIYTYWGGSNQKWNIADLGSSVYSIRSYQSGNLAADVWNFGTVNGTNIALYTYWGGNSQKYYFASVSGYYRITPYISSGQCLDAYGTANGSNVGTWSYWGGTNQQWSVLAP